MGLRLIPCSPWRRIPLASIAGGLKASSKPGWISQNLRRLDTSHGCQNHTALPSATAPFVGARPSLTGFKPALRKPACAPGAPRPPLPAPNVRDDRDTPLLWARDGGSCTGDLGRTRSGIFFARWTGQVLVICPSGQCHTEDQGRHCDEGVRSNTAVHRPAGRDRPHPSRRAARRDPLPRRGSWKVMAHSPPSCEAKRREIAFCTRWEMVRFASLESRRESAHAAASGSALACAGGTGIGNFSNCFGKFTGR